MLHTVNLKMMTSHAGGVLIDKVRWQHKQQKNYCIFTAIKINKKLKQEQKIYAIKSITIGDNNIAEVAALGTKKQKKVMEIKIK